MFVQPLAKVTTPNGIFHLINLNKKIGSLELIQELRTKNLKLYQVQSCEKLELAKTLKEKYGNFLPVVFAEDEYLQFGEISTSKETKENLSWSPGVHFAVTQI